jgi:hypothetical protein
VALEAHVHIRAKGVAFLRVWLPVPLHGCCDTQAEVAQRGGPMVAAEAADELLADTQRALELTHGRRDLGERNFLQFRISQTTLERGVFMLELFEPLASSARPD